MNKDNSPTPHLLYGRNPVAEWLKKGNPTDTVWLSDNLDPKSIAYFTAIGRENGAVVKRTKAGKLDEMTHRAAHQGVVASAAEIEYCALEDLLTQAQSQGEPPFLLVLDGVEDPHNLGALLRSALLCGVHGAVIPARGSASVTAVAMKASAGAAALLPVARVPNVGQALRSLKQAGVFVYCADTQGPPPDRLDLSGPLALVVGNEGKGVSPLVRKLCDGALSLPMKRVGGVDSFNVSVAGGILMHHVYSRYRNL